MSRDPVKVFKNLLLLVLASILFFFSNPNFIIHQGLGFLGFFELVPVFIAVKRFSLKNSWLYGFFYGALSYGLFCYWFSGYNQHLLYICVPAFGIIMALVFFCMCAVKNLFPRHSFLMMGLVWLVYEYLKTKGFLGFPYGIIGYTQWKNLLMIQSAALGGVWWISSLCVLFSSYVAWLIDFCISGKKNGTKKIAKMFWTESRFASIFILIFFVFTVGYGIFSLNKNELNTRSVKIVCVQNNTDSNKYGFEVYKRDVSVLMNLTEKALVENPDADFVVWPETAVVPPIMYHYEKKVNKNRYDMIVELLDYIESKDSCFVLGNQRSVDNGGDFTDDYNSVLVFDRRDGNVNPPDPQVYSKIHLVPFKEYFPYEKTFPGIYKLFLGDDDTLWTPGTEYKVFDERGVKFSTPVCFEDTFGDACRKFVRNGASCFFNLSNDSWSKSSPCQMQHLSMAVFRSVENSVPSARATGSGVTCIIDSKGRVVSMTAEFEKNYLAGEIKISDTLDRTIYNRFGDWLPVLQTVLLAGLVVARIGRSITKRYKSDLEDRRKIR